MIKPVTMIVCCVMASSAFAHTKLFPKLANTWDSLAEAYWKAGRREKAIEYYKKAIELDPHGRTGENARAMLKQIEAQED